MPDLCCEVDSAVGRIRRKRRLEKNETWLLWYLIMLRLAAHEIFSPLLSVEIEFSGDGRSGGFKTPCNQYFSPEEFWEQWH